MAQPTWLIVLLYEDVLLVSLVPLTAVGDSTEVPLLLLRR